MALLKSCGCAAVSSRALKCGTRPIRALPSGQRAAAALPRAARLVSTHRRAVVVRADSRSGESNFMAGFVVGGVVFGALGFIFAPQISKALLGDESRLKLPRFMEDESPKDPEATKQDLIDKIAQLNASIDEVAATLKTKEATSAAVTASTEEVLKTA